MSVSVLEMGDDAQERDTVSDGLRLLARLIARAEIVKRSDASRIGEQPSVALDDPSDTASDSL